MNDQAIQPGTSRLPHKPKVRPPRFEPDPQGRYCDKHTKAADGHLCDNPAGYRTDHPGIGPCRFHGGVLGALKSGRYSVIKHRELRGLIEEFERDPDPLNMLAEVATLRALFVDWINRYHEGRAALLAWYESQLRGGEAERPRQILDITDGHRLVVEATKIIKRIEDIRAANAISIGDLNRLMIEMARVVERWIMEPELTPEQRLAKIRDGWLAVRL